MHYNNENIDESNLREFATQGGFTVPKGYFAQLNKYIIEATTQTQCTKTTFAQVPQAYFEQSRKAILAKTVQQTQPLTIKWYRQKWIQTTIAACIVAVVLLGWYTIKPAQQAMAYNQVTADDIVAYFEQNDIRDIPITEVSLTLIEQTPVFTPDEILTQTEYELTEEL
jgi:hypothetical protein